MDDIFFLNDSDLLDTSLQMPKLICYLQLLNLPKNLSWSIILDWLFFEILEYYLVWISIIILKMTLELDNIANFIPYFPTFSTSKSDIENNKGINLSNNNLPFPTS